MPAIRPGTQMESVTRRHYNGSILISIRYYRGSGIRRSPLGPCGQCRCLRVGSSALPPRRVKIRKLGNLPVL